MSIVVRAEELKRGFILPSQNSANQQLFNGGNPGVNFYKIVTQFYQHAMWGQLPRVDQADDLFAAFENSTLQRSINGIAAVIRLPNATVVPSGRHIWRWEENGVLMGYIIGWPFSTDRNQVMNRMRIFIHQIDRPLIFVQDWEVSGGSLGNQLSNAIVPAQVGVWGNYDNDYDDMKSVVTAFNTRITLNSSLLDRHSSPHLTGPSEARNDQGGFEYNKDGMFLPLDQDSAEYKYLTWDSPETLNRFHTNTLIDMLHMITGVPATAFGLSQEPGQSGRSRERQMFAALSKVRLWRRDVENAMMQFGVSDVKWVDDPFINWVESVNAELSLVSAGVITAEEARARLNIG